LPLKFPQKYAIAFIFRKTTDQDYFFTSKNEKSGKINYIPSASVFGIFPDDRETNGHKQKCTIFQLLNVQFPFTGKCRRAVTKIFSLYLAAHRPRTTIPPHVSRET